MYQQFTCLQATRKSSSGCLFKREKLKWSDCIKEKNDWIHDAWMRFLCILCVSFYYRPKRAVSGSLKNTLFAIASKSYDADYLARIGRSRPLAQWKRCTFRINTSQTSNCSLGLLSNPLSSAASRLQSIKRRRYHAIKDASRQYKYRVHCASQSLFKSLSLCKYEQHMSLRWKE